MKIDGSTKARDQGGKLVVLALLMQGNALRKALSGWEPVALLFDTLADAAHGAALTDDDARRVRSWSRRWRALGEQRRAFYAEHAGLHDAAGAALFHVLEGSPHSIHDHTRAGVLRLWERWAGSPATAPLWPLLP